MHHLVSIGLPVFNGSAYLAEALDSICSQTHKSLEIIISDNASSDNTQEICMSFAQIDHRIHYYRQIENIGAANNFLFVSQQASAKYFMWAAADDLWHPQWVEELLVACIKYSCLVYGKLLQIDANGAELALISSGRTFSFTQRRIIRRLRYLLEYIGLGKCNPIYGLFPTDHLTQELVQTLSLPYGSSDALFLYNYLHKHKICSVSSVTMRKRIIQSTPSTNIVSPSSHAALPLIPLKTLSFLKNRTSSYLRLINLYERVYNDPLEIIVHRALILILPINDLIRFFFQRIAPRV
jgi:glycosyltransferase involved in cell wall biosynthesis